MGEGAIPKNNQRKLLMKNAKTIFSSRTTSASSSIYANPNRLCEPTWRFLRGLLMLSLALGSLIALSARGQTNYTGAHYFITFAGAAIGDDGTGKLALFDR